jgi:hypothetical protein
MARIRNNPQFVRIIEGLEYRTGALMPTNPENWNEAPRDRMVMAVELPPFKDLSAEPYFPKVDSQGKLGSCAAWAQIYYSLGYQWAKANNLSGASVGDKRHLLNPVFNYNRANGGQDGGSFMDDCAMTARFWGIPTRESMPGTVDYLTWGDETVQRSALVVRAGSISYLSNRSPSLIEEMKQSILDGVPVTFCMDAYQFGDALEGDFIITAEEYVSNTMNHAQTICGYDDSVADSDHPDERGAFKVVNSWGAGWGNKGYYWVTYECMRKLAAGGLLFATIAKYAPGNPTMLARVEFSDAPTRQYLIEYELLDESGKGSIKQSPYYRKNSSTSRATYPCPMIIDVSSLTEYRSAENDNLHLMLSGTAYHHGMIDTVTIEETNTTSTNLTDTPTPCDVVIDLGAKVEPEPEPIITVPDAPTELKVVPGDGKATLAWAAPANDGGSAVIGYGVYLNGNWFYLGSDTSITMSGLTNGTTYTACVTAENRVGQSIASESISFKPFVPAPPSPPAPLFAVTDTFPFVNGFSVGRIGTKRTIRTVRVSASGNPDKTYYSKGTDAWKEWPGVPMITEPAVFRFQTTSKDGGAGYVSTFVVK